MRELPLQCAWCRRLYQGGTIAEPPLATLVGGTSHGICPACLALVLGRRRDLLRAAGDLRRAREIGRHLRAVLAGLRARRAAGRRP